jgi:hypothetical protein
VLNYYSIQLGLMPVKLLQDTLSTELNQNSGQPFFRFMEDKESGAIFSPAYKLEQSNDNCRHLGPEHLLPGKCFLLGKRRKVGGN